jgi:hypothetical protein
MAAGLDICDCLVDIAERARLTSHTRVAGGVQLARDSLNGGGSLAAALEHRDYLGNSRRWGADVIRELDGPGDLDAATAWVAA